VHYVVLASGLVIETSSTVIRIQCDLLMTGEPSRKNLVLFLKGAARFSGEVENRDLYIRYFEERGVKSIALPPLSYSVAYENESLLYEALNNVNAYSGLIVTSKRALLLLQLVIKKLEEHQVKKILSTPLYVVGPSTKLAAEKLFFIDCRGGHSHNAQALAEYILSSSSATSSPFLYLCGNNHLRTVSVKFASKGYLLEEIISYKITENEGFKEKLKALLVQEAISHIVFFSPSAVSFSLPVLLACLLHKLYTPMLRALH
jgi:uroporphyrinogen-III synthase